MAVYDEPFWRARRAERARRRATPARCASTFDNSPPRRRRPACCSASSRATSRAAPGLRRGRASARAGLGVLRRACSASARATPERYVEKSWAEEEWTRGCYGCSMTHRRVDVVRPGAARADRADPLGGRGDRDDLERLHGRRGAVRRARGAGGPGMSRLRVHISMSLDGYVAGPNQSEEHPLGEGGEQLHEWVVSLAAWREPHGLEGGEVNASTPVMEETHAQRRRDDHGPQHVRRRAARGASEPWNGWWGDDPPFHHPVFVLTHHAREPLEHAGRHDVPLRHRRHRVRARAGAGGGGRAGRRARAAAPTSVRQYLRAGLVDEMTLQRRADPARRRRAAVRRRRRRGAGARAARGSWRRRASRT